MAKPQAGDAEAQAKEQLHDARSIKQEFMALWKLAWPTVVQTASQQVSACRPPCNECLEV